MRQSEIAVFPLEGVLLPSMVLPLNIFEPRYIQMVREVADGTNQFGVVLLRRGSEVGVPEAGTDFDRVRTVVGTMASVLDSQVHGGGIRLLTGGAERFRVVHWLSDRPYPRASVEFWPMQNDDLEGNEHTAQQALGDEVAHAVQQLEDLGGLLQRAGVSLGPVPDLSTDPVIAIDQLCVVAPLQPYDRQRLLESPGSNERLGLLRSLVSDLRTFVELQLDQEL